MRRKTHRASRKLSKNRRRNTFKKRKTNRKRGGLSFGTNCADKKKYKYNFYGFKYLKDIYDKSGFKNSSRYMIKLDSGDKVKVETGRRTGWSVNPPTYKDNLNILFKAEYYSIRYSNFHKLKDSLRYGTIPHEPFIRQGVPSDAVYEALSKFRSTIQSLKLPKKSECMKRAEFIDKIFKELDLYIRVLQNLSILKPFWDEVERITNILSEFGDFYDKDNKRKKKPSVKGGGGRYSFGTNCAHDKLYNYDFDSYKYLKDIIDRSGLKNSSYYIMIFEDPYNLKSAFEKHQYAIRYSNFNRLVNNIRNAILRKGAPVNNEQISPVSKKLSELSKKPKKSDCTRRAKFIDDVFKCISEYIGIIDASLTGDDASKEHVYIKRVLSKFGIFADINESRW